jgi:hypothetical protein
MLDAPCWRVAFGAIRLVDVQCVAAPGRAAITFGRYSSHHGEVDYRPVSLKQASLGAGSL